MKCSPQINAYEVSDLLVKIAADQSQTLRTGVVAGPLISALARAGFLTRVTSVMSGPSVSGRSSFSVWKLTEKGVREAMKREAS